METEHKKTLQSILDWHKNEIERLKNEQNKTSALTDPAKYFCIEGEIHTLRITYQKLLDFQQNDAMAIHLAETIEDNIRQGCELANNEVAIAGLKKEVHQLEKLISEERRKCEDLEISLKLSRNCNIESQTRLNKIHKLAAEIANESEI